MSSDKKIFYQTLLDRLLKEDQFLLNTHLYADPDGIGSELALEHLLRKLGKDVIIANNEFISPKYRFLDPDGRIRTIKECDEYDLRDRMIVFLDNSEISRSGLPDDVIKSDFSNLVVIDHHDGAHPDTHTFFQDATVGSTAEMIYELYETLGLKISNNIALALYAGLVSDNGHFRYNKTRPRTHEIAARLLHYKIRPEEVAERLNNSFPTGRLHLKKNLYNRLELNSDNTIAWFRVYRSDLDEHELSPLSLDGIVNELIEAESVQIGVMFFEREPDLTKVTVRSRGRIDLLPAVERFGGGGHKNACGALIKLDLERAIREFIPIVTAQL